jgi:hypothetical protein
MLGSILFLAFKISLAFIGSVAAAVQLMSQLAYVVTWEGLHAGHTFQFVTN